MNTLSWTYFLSYLIILVVLLLLLRPVVLWYLGMFFRQKQNKEIIKLLTEIRDAKR